MDPLQLLDDVERDLGISLYPVTWPIFDMDRFVGVYDRLTKHVLLFERGEHHGATEVATIEGGLDSPEIHDHASAYALARLREELELLDVGIGEFDHDAFIAGQLSPTFFGSALTNFGVEPFLREFVQLAPSPVARESSDGPVEPNDPRFAGFVFKIQANMDPKHRDRMAFVRVCSGRYAAGMKVKLTRTGKMLRLAAPQSVMARERSAVEEAFPGDVVGIVDKGTLRIGDTLAEDRTIEFQGIPRFPPEHFMRVLSADPMRRKQLDTGLKQLSEEGAAQVFFAEAEAKLGSGPSPIVGAIGQLQFDVMMFRLESEYGAPAKLEAIGYGYPRWVTGPRPEIERVGSGHGRLLVWDAKGNPIILFADKWAMRSTLDRETKVQFHEAAP
jgi:peptide chain release factor 3